MASIRRVTMNDLREMTGKTVWFRSTHAEVNVGVVESVLGMNHVDVKVIQRQHEVIKGCERHMYTAEAALGNQAVHVNDIYLRKEDLLSANYGRFKSTVCAYCSGINNVAELVKFCYTHNICGGDKDTDWEARAAVREMAKKFFDMEVDPEVAGIEKDLNKPDWEDKDE